MKGKKIYLLARLGIGLGSATIQVDSNELQTINFSTTYPTNTSDVSTPAICSYFYKRFLIFDGAEAEHNITLTQVSGDIPFYGFEIETDNQSYYNSPIQNAGVSNFTGNGVKNVFSTQITFKNPHRTIPSIICTSNSLDNIVAVLYPTTTTCQIYVAKKIEVYIQMEKV